MGPELLALLLLPRMFETAKKSATKPRLVVVSSDTLYRADIPEDMIGASNIHKWFSDKKNWGESTLSEPRYRIEKMFNAFFVRSLADRTKTIHVNAVSPGFCMSGLRRNSGEEYLQMEQDYALTTEEGARHIIFNALWGLGDAEKEPELHGAYTSVSEFQEISDFVLSDVGQKMQSRLWDEMVEILNNVDSRVSETVDRL